MNEPNTREVFRQAIDLLTGNESDDDAVRGAYELLNSLSPDQLRAIGEAQRMLMVAIEMTRKKKIKDLAGRN